MKPAYVFLLAVLATLVFSPYALASGMKIDVLTADHLYTYVRQGRSDTTIATALNKPIMIPYNQIVHIWRDTPEPQYICDVYAHTWVSGAAGAFYSGTRHYCVAITGYCHQQLIDGDTAKLRMGYQNDGTDASRREEGYLSFYVGKDSSYCGDALKKMSVPWQP